MTEQSPVKPTEVLRQIVFLGKNVYTRKGWTAFKNEPLSGGYESERHLSKTPRELIAEGKREVVLDILAAEYEASSSI